VLQDGAWTSIRTNPSFRYNNLPLVCRLIARPGVESRDATPMQMLPAVDIVLMRISSTMR
jgi:hypothetical protein